MNINESIEALHYWPLWRESTSDQWIPLTKGQQFSMSWRHHVLHHNPSITPICWRSMISWSSVGTYATPCRQSKTICRHSAESTMSPLRLVKLAPYHMWWRIFNSLWPSIATSWRRQFIKCVWKIQNVTLLPHLPGTVELTMCNVNDVWHCLCHFNAKEVLKCKYIFIFSKRRCIRDHVGHRLTFRDCSPTIDRSFPTG